MNEYKVGDRVWWSECGMKLIITSVREFSLCKYSCVDRVGDKWNWFRPNELKPIKICYATLGKTGV